MTLVLLFEISIHIKQVNIMSDAKFGLQFISSNIKTKEKYIMHILFCELWLSIDK